MANILLAWEYGGGFGHIAQLLPVARALKARGHSVTLALRELKETAPMLPKDEFALIAAPVLKPLKPWDKDAPTDTLADAFVLCGWDHAPALAQLAEAWQKVLAETKPDMVICETSPTLAMVTLGRIPTLTIGNGYSLPPPGKPLRSVRFWKNDTPIQSIANEQRMVKAVNAVREQLHLPAVQFFSDLFGGEASFVTCLPELDCFRKDRNTPAIGMPEIPPQPVLQEAPAEPLTVFLYLSAEYEHLDAVMHAVGKSGLASTGYIRGLPAQRREKFAREGVTLSEIPLPIWQTLPDKALLVHHGGMSTTDTGLRCGVPQLVLPRNLEQKANAACVYYLSCGALLQQHEIAAKPEALLPAVTGLASHAKARANAQKLALGIRARKLRPAVEILVEMCENIFQRKYKATYG